MPGQKKSSISPTTHLGELERIAQAMIEAGLGKDAEEGKPFDFLDAMKRTREQLEKDRER